MIYPKFDEFHRYESSKVFVAFNIQHMRNVVKFAKIVLVIMKNIIRIAKSDLMIR